MHFEFTEVSPVDRVRKFLAKQSQIFRTLGFVLVYGIWVLLIRLLTLSLITYFTISPTSHFQDISDAFSSNEVSLMGLSAVLFVALLSSLHPLTATTTREVATRHQIEKNFLPGFVQGTIFAGGMIAAFVLSGVYRYLGYFIPLNEAPLELINVLLRTAALGVLAYCEEFIFHYKIPIYLNNTIPPFASASLIAFLYCIVKVLQFDLGVMHLITLFLVSIALFYRTLNDGEFSKGAGYWAAILIVFQPLLSLPIFGNNFPGILLMKYQPHFGKIPDFSTSMFRLLTGGAGGPISSFVFQLLLILDIGRSTLRRKMNQNANLKSVSR